MATAQLLAIIQPRLVERTDVVGAHLCDADAAVSQIATEEKQDRGGSDALVRWVVLVEGSAVEPVAAACREYLATELLPARRSRWLERDLPDRLCPRGRRYTIAAGGRRTKRDTHVGARHSEASVPSLPDEPVNARRHQSMGVRATG
jgi:hypothetical protein